MAPAGHTDVQAVFDGLARIHVRCPVAIATAKQHSEVGAANAEHTNRCAHFVIRRVFLADRPRDSAEASLDERDRTLVIRAFNDRRGGRGVGILVDANCAVRADRDFRAVDHQQLRARGIAGRNRIAALDAITFRERNDGVALRGYSAFAEQDRARVVCLDGGRAKHQCQRRKAKFRDDFHCGVHRS